jgi:hypothetical protein
MRIRNVSIFISAEYFNLSVSFTFQDVLRAIFNNSSTFHRFQLNTKITQPGNHESTGRDPATVQNN